jgi:hypothetical protein
MRLFRMRSNDSSVFVVISAAVFQTVILSDRCDRLYFRDFCGAAMSMPYPPMLGRVHTCAVVRDGPRNRPPRWRIADLGLRPYETLPSAGYDKANVHSAGDRSRPAYRRGDEERSEEEDKGRVPVVSGGYGYGGNNPIDDTPQPTSNGIECPAKRPGSCLR